MATYYCYNCQDEGERLHVDATVSADRVYAHCPACRQYKLHRVLDGEAAKVAGTERANANPANAPWRAVALPALERLIASGDTFTSEDLTDIVGVPASGAAVGALFRVAHARGLIEFVGLANAKRPESHSATLKVWRGRAEVAA